MTKTPLLPADERQPDEVITVRLREGYDVVVYSFGRSDEVLFCANGGPGLPCDYVRDSHSVMADKGYRVVAWDQLGCGRSDRPDDARLWRLDRYVEEIEQIRQALSLDRIHYLGQSWGCDMGIEYALKYPAHLKSLTLEGGASNTAHAVRELNRLRAALGSETVAMMRRHEAAGTLAHPEYQAAITLLDYRHTCRLEQWPAALQRSIAGWNMAIYETIQGPNEFTYTGNCKDWDRSADLHRITCPTLVLAGRHDSMTPACAAEIHNGLPDSRLHIFENSSHMPFFEEPDAYFVQLERFLKSVCQGQ